MGFTFQIPTVECGQIMLIKFEIFLIAFGLVRINYLSCEENLRRDARENIFNWIYDETKLDLSKHLNDSLLLVIKDLEFKFWMRYV